MMNKEQIKIAVIGLGYVGLPLAIEFGKKYEVTGFDINTKRIEELSAGHDKTLQIDTIQFEESKHLTFSNNRDNIKESNIYIVTVPTPVDEFKKPDLRLLNDATTLIAELLKTGDIVIYESTVYPGCTEEQCVPILEKISGLKFNTEFFCGYSPERINPGDKKNTLTKIKKVTSGSTPETAWFVNDLYQSIIEAGTHLAPSIKVAEASKAIENAQRDVNISFVNELAVIFEKLDIDTNDVLEAAATKWNFLKFQPGLVGGHCIAVDPYYLMHKAESVGYYPQVILSGRRVNDNMGLFIANKIIKLMIKKGQRVDNARALILGITFKENCPDIRNTRIIDVYNELSQFGLIVDIYDPLADKEEVREEYNIKLLNKIDGKYDVILLAVAHDEFSKIYLDDIKYKNAVVFDCKAKLDRNVVDFRL